MVFTNNVANIPVSHFNAICTRYEVTKKLFVLFESELDTLLIRKARFSGEWMVRWIHAVLSHEAVPDNHQSGHRSEAKH